MVDPLPFIVPGLLVVGVLLFIGLLAGPGNAPSAPKPDQAEPTDLDLLRAEIRELKRRHAIEKGGAR